eukprot:tig00020965_g16861.t1
MGMREHAADDAEQVALMDHGSDHEHDRKGQTHAWEFKPPAPRPRGHPAAAAYLASSDAAVALAPYSQSTVGDAIRTRGPWLLVLFIGGICTGHVMQVFEGELKRNIELSYFIPLLIGTGGNTGSQTVSTIIRALALHDVRPTVRDLLSVLAREAMTGLGVGSGLAVVAFLLASLWGMPSSVSLVVAVSTVVITLWANCVGAAVPLLACRFGVDPAVLSAPVCTTLVDATGLTIYFLTAKLFLSV